MVPMRAHSSSVATPAEPCSPARADPAGGLRGRASATFFGLLIVGLLAGCGSGGSGGGSSGGSSSNQVIATGVISPDGGQIIGNTPDGQTVILDVPPDSVPQDVAVSISTSVPSSVSAALSVSNPASLGQVVGRIIDVTASTTYFGNKIPIGICTTSTIQAGVRQVLAIAAQYNGEWEILRPSKPTNQINNSQCAGNGIWGEFNRLNNGTPTSFTAVLVNLPTSVLSPVAGNNRSGPICLNSSPSFLSGVSAATHAASLPVGRITA